MEFELTPSDLHRSVSSDSLLADLLRVARITGKCPVTLDEYFRYGHYKASVIKKRFGSWRKALEEAGVSSACVPPGELLTDLKRVSEYLGRGVLTEEEYDRQGKYSFRTVLRRFGSWHAALEKAGLKSARRPLRDSTLYQPAIKMRL